MSLIPIIRLELVVKVAFVIVLAWLTNRVIGRFIRIPEKLSNRRVETLTSVGKSIASILIWLAALYIIFILLNVDVTPLLASAGIAGVALGFGARSLIEDLLSGFFLLIEDSIAVGDLIRAAGAEGIVKNISFRTITLRDRDGALHIIPNGQIGEVVNLSRAKARVNIDFAVSSDSKIDKALQAAEKTLIQIREDEEYGKMVVLGSEVKGIENFETGGRVVIKVVVFTHWSNQWELARRFRYLLKKNLESASIPLA